MGSIFDEEQYLTANPDVAEAVRSGKFASGLEHYQALGMAEGRMVVADVPPIWFTHIPKCGGTTVTAAISKAIPKFQIVPDVHMFQRRNGAEPSADAIAMECREAAFPLRLVHGHYHHSLNRLVPNAIKIVILRDPCTRTVSHLNHAVNHHGISAQSVKATLARGELPFPDNLMTRFLGGTIDLAGGLHDQQDAALHNPIDAPSYVLESAVAALARADVVGLLEQFGDFKINLSRLGFEIGDRWENRGKRSGLALSPKDYEVIRQKNLIDWQLYDIAKGMLSS